MDLILNQMGIETFGLRSNFMEFSQGYESKSSLAKAKSSVCKYFAHRNERKISCVYQK